MSENLNQINELKHAVITHPPCITPFTRYDVGWVILCIGMAIGGGIIFLPLQIGLKGIWAFCFSLIVAYPAIYFLQDLYLKTLSASPQCDSYSGVLSHYLGANWGIGLGVAYFVMLLNGILTYSLAATFDSASYLHNYGWSTDLLSDYSWYGLLVLTVLVCLASQGEKLLFKTSGPMIIVKLAIVVFLGIAMIPYWKLENVAALPGVFPLIKDTVLTLPFTLFSILFVQILSPMNIAYRKVESDISKATYRAIRVHRIAYGILAVSVVFYALSFTFALSPEEAQMAANSNVSAAAIATKAIPDNIVAIMATMLTIFAILTAFLGIYLGVQDAIKGIVVNVLNRTLPGNAINTRKINFGIAVFVILSLWAWVLTRFPILLLQHIWAPVYGVVSCLIPCYLVYKVADLRQYRGWRIYYVAFMGLLLCLSPLFMFFE